MNLIRQLTKREKFLVFITILLAAALLAGWKPTQAALTQEAQYSNERLYALADQYSKSGDLAIASAYLYAYIQRNPPNYANNIGGHRDAVNGIYQRWLGIVRSDLAWAKEVVKHLNSCEQYPCKDEDNSGGLSSSFSREFPFDMVMVCEDSHYRGRCSYLEIGDYTRWQNLGVRNDSISSVMVGRQVQVLLCAHNFRIPDRCLTFTGSDNNLNDNRFPGSSENLNDRVSTARVTFKPNQGLTLP